MKSLLWIGLFATPSANAMTFKNMEGTYRIRSCQSLTSPTQEHLCDYESVVVHPEANSTAIYFRKTIGAQILVRSYGFPASTAGEPSAHYREADKNFASYTNHDRDTSETTTLNENADGSYKLFLERTSHSFRTHDLFELNLQKISDQSTPLPTVPPDPNDDD